MKTKNNCGFTAKNEKKITWEIKQKKTFNKKLLESFIKDILKVEGLPPPLRKKIELLKSFLTVDRRTRNKKGIRREASRLKTWSRMIKLNIWRNEGMAMVLWLAGNSDIGAHVWREICNLIRSTAAAYSIFPNFLHECALCSELPSNIITLGMYGTRRE